MLFRKILKRHMLVAFIAALALVSCNHYMSTYDQFAYAQTTAIKVDVLNLIEKSGGSYNSHKDEADEVVSKMFKAIEYEKHRQKNDITLRMWDKLIDSTKQKGIVGSYLASWKRSGTKSQTLQDEYKPLVSEGFNLIADLEAQKIKATDAGIAKFLNK